MLTKNINMWNIYIIHIERYMRVQNWLHLSLTTMEINQSCRWTTWNYTWKVRKWMKNTRNLRAFSPLIEQYKKLQTIRESDLKIQKTTFLLSVYSLNHGFWLGQMSIFILLEFLLFKLILLGLQYSKLAFQDIPFIFYPFSTKIWDKLLQSGQEIKNILLEFIK